MLFLVRAVYGTLIAAFASHMAPPVVKRPARIHGTSLDVWMVPLRNTYSTLAYADRDSIHYFRYTFDSVVVQTVWSRHLTVPEKAAVFDAVRAWYLTASNNTLTSNLTLADDVGFLKRRASHDEDNGYGEEEVDDHRRYVDQVAARDLVEQTPSD